MYFSLPSMWCIRRIGGLEIPKALFTMPLDKLCERWKHLHSSFFSNRFVRDHSPCQNLHIVIHLSDLGTRPHACARRWHNAYHIVFVSIAWGPCAASANGWVVWWRYLQNVIEKGCSFLFCPLTCCLLFSERKGQSSDNAHLANERIRLSNLIRGKVRFIPQYLLKHWTFTTYLFITIRPQIQLSAGCYKKASVRPLLLRFNLAIASISRLCIAICKIL